MFPAPSPNSQALFQQLQSGGATPGTLDFHRTAMNAAARSKSGFSQGNQSEQQTSTSAPMDSKPVSSDPFASHDQEAANGLFMLAKGGPGNAFPHNQPVHPPQPQPQQSDQAQLRKARNNGSIGSISGVSGGNGSVGGDHSDSHDEKPSARGKGKKNTKGAATTNGRRKADDTPQKGPNKKAKSNNGTSIDPALENRYDEDDDDSEEDDGGDGEHTGNKKMTDEEKRKNFLERNR